VLSVPATASGALAALAQRTMQLQCTIQDGQIWMTGGDQSVQIELTALKGISSS